MKDLVFITVQPSDTYYTWQVNMWLESAREFGYSDKAQVLIYNPDNRILDKEWENLFSRYTESKFFIYDDSSLRNLLGIYIPILRPFTLAKHFKKYPELKEKAIFYCDSDIIFTKPLDIDKYKDDDVNYLSDTISYVGGDYLESKINDVIPSKLETYKKRDIIGELGAISGIGRDVIMNNKHNAGGAQYLLKNIDSDFWMEVFNSTINIRIHLLAVNKQFFISEDTGFQSWCADMWGVFHTLLRFEKEVKVVKEMDFSHATDDISRLQQVSIYHNAGISSDCKIKRRSDKKDIDCPAFYKGKYIDKSPFQSIDELIEMSKNEDLQQFCNSFYLQKLIELSKKYNLKY